MSVHTIRFPDLIDGCKPVRDLLRAKAPNGRDGFVVSDLDLIVRWWGPRYGLDGEGVFALIEVKRQGTPLPTHQRITFRLIDRMVRAHPEAADRYLGFHVLHDLEGRWRWHGDRTTCSDDELVAELEGWPRGLTC